MLRYSRAFASLVLVFGVLTSAWATCVEGATLPTEQMVCCQAGHEHCPMKDSASDCCRKSPSHVESQATIIKAASVSVPMPLSVPTVWVTLAIASVAQSQHRVSYDASPPGLRLSPPAYIAFSALLI
jgi:hypothetical protein